MEEWGLIHLLLAVGWHVEGQHTSLVHVHTHGKSCSINPSQPLAVAECNCDSVIFRF